MERSDYAKARLLALKQPVPRPTKAMLAQNKAEEAARREPTTMAAVMAVLSRHPDVSAATNVGDPTLQDQDLISAKDVVQASTRAVGGTAEHNVTLQTIKDVPTENQPPPRSDEPAAPPPTNAPDGQDTTAQQPGTNNDLKFSGANAPPAAQPDASDSKDELKPNVPQDAQPPAAPAQVNEIAPGTNGGGAPASASASQGSNQDLASDEMIASSKHKKKKGLQKIIPGK